MSLTRTKKKRQTPISIVRPSPSYRVPYGIVYRALDTSNGKSYIGQTVQTLDARRKAHFYVRSGCHKFRNALLARPEAFTWSIIQECTDQVELDAAEAAWIKELDTVLDGYNLKWGGGAHGKLSDEVKQVITEKRRGRKHSPEAKQKMREARKRLWADPAFKEKMSRKQQELWQQAEHRQRMAAAGFRPDVKKGRSYSRDG